MADINKVDGFDQFDPTQYTDGKVYFDQITQSWKIDNTKRGCVCDEKSLTDLVDKLNKINWGAITGGGQSQSGLTFTGNTKIISMGPAFFFNEELSNGTWVMTDVAEIENNSNPDSLLSGDGGPFVKLQFKNGKQGYLAYDDYRYSGRRDGDAVTELSTEGDYPVLAKSEVVMRNYYNPTTLVTSTHDSYLGGNYFKEYFNAGNKLYVLWRNPELPNDVYPVFWWYKNGDSILLGGNSEYTTQYSPTSISIKNESILNDLAADGTTTLEFLISTTETMPEISEDNSHTVLDITGVGKVGIPIIKIEPVATN